MREKNGEKENGKNENMAFRKQEFECLPPKLDENKLAENT